MESGAELARVLAILLGTEKASMVIWLPVKRATRARDLITDVEVMLVLLVFGFKSSKMI